MKIQQIIESLRAPFPKEVVSWRAQHFTQDGTKALALAYIDCRDVQNRLDDVCTPFGWSSEHIIGNGSSKVSCKIGIKNPETNEWVWKSDGAGETDIEGDKGSFSDATKRAAVSWGIGRYLYDLDAVWVPCEAEQRNGKWVFKKWAVDPWTKVKPEKKAGFETARAQNAKWEHIADEIRLSDDAKELQSVWEKYQPELNMFMRSDKQIFDSLVTIKENKKMELAALVGMSPEFCKIAKESAHG